MISVKVVILIVLSIIFKKHFQVFLENALKEEMLINALNAKILTYIYNIIPRAIV